MRKLDKVGIHQALSEGKEIIVKSFRKPYCSVGTVAVFLVPFAVLIFIVIEFFRCFGSDEPPVNGVIQ